MAEAELTIKYRNRPVTCLFWIMSFVFPAMVFIFFWSSLVLLSNIYTSGLREERTLLLIALNLLIGILSGLVLFLASDQIVFITRDGITLPFFLCPGPWLRVRKKWSELMAIKFSDRSNNADLQLIFKGGQSARLNLRTISQKQLSKMIMALDVWAYNGEYFTALLEARTALLSDKESNEHKQLNGSNGEIKYTELWHEELARRFGATNFIPLEPGQKVLDEGYTIERQLAFGGLSAIYLARDIHLRRVILKEAVVPQSEDQKLIEKSHNLLNREATMLAALSHEQIASVYDHFVDNGRHYLVIEYIPGQDLRQLVREEGAQKEAQVVAWAIAMTQMLVYLHEQPEPIIHRDFTPDNLILKSDGTIAVIDFGAANFFLGTATGTMIGKQAYIAPEQLRGKATPQSDIYAFGACLYYLSTGEDPEPLAVSHPKHKVSGLSDAFDRIVSSCTQMEKEDRPQTARNTLVMLESLKKEGHAV